MFDELDIQFDKLMAEREHIRAIRGAETDPRKLDELDRRIWIITSRIDEVIVAMGM